LDSQREKAESKGKESQDDPGLTKREMKREMHDIPPL